LARKEYDPDYTISGGYFNQGGMPPMYPARADFKLPPYFWRKQRDGRTPSADEFYDRGGLRIELPRRADAIFI
jgi:hypothetical protein